MPKIEWAQLELSAVNPNIRIDAINDQLDDKHMAAHIAACDLLLDCSDNVSTSDRLNLFCHAQRKALVSDAAIRLEGLLSVFTYQPG